MIDEEEVLRVSFRANFSNGLEGVAVRAPFEAEFSKIFERGELRVDSKTDFSKKGKKEPALILLPCGFLQEMREREAAAISPNPASEEKEG